MIVLSIPWTCHYWFIFLFYIVTENTVLYCLWILFFGIGGCPQYTVYSWQGKSYDCQPSQLCIILITVHLFFYYLLLVHKTTNLPTSAQKMQSTVISPSPPTPKHDTVAAIYTSTKNDWQLPWLKLTLISKVKLRKRHLIFYYYYDTWLLWFVELQDMNLSSSEPSGIENLNGKY